MWDKLPDNILTKLNNEKKIQPSEYHAINRLIADHLMYKLKDTSRSIVKFIANEIIETYPISYQDDIQGSVWSDGKDTLTASIINCIQYKKVREKRNQTLDDVASEVIPSKRLKKQLQQDSYGCVAYRPSIDPGNLETLEEKRVRLEELFNNYNRTENEDKEVKILMMETYAYQREVIIINKGAIDAVSVQWPFLKDIFHLLDHFCTLMGKNLYDIWLKSLTGTCKHMRQFFKIPINMQERNAEVIRNIIRTSKESSKSLRAETPKL